MPVLSNARHELFAQSIAEGKTATEAYVLAGYKDDDGNACKMAARPEVQARIQEITGAAAEKVGVTCEAVLGELAKIGFSNMLDYIQIDGDGRPYTDFSALTRDQAAAIQEVNVETIPGSVGSEDSPGRPEVTKVRFKLSDKRAALVDLGKHLGMFKERIEHTGKDGGPIQTENTSDLEVARRIAFVLERGMRAGEKG